jgi:hypothetical protein
MYRNDVLMCVFLYLLAITNSFRLDPKLRDLTCKKRGRIPWHQLHRFEVPGCAGNFQVGRDSIHDKDEYSKGVGLQMR